MKQHITPEQLDELSKKGKKGLRKWCQAHPLQTGSMIIDDEIYYLLSIGQMVEFLGDDWWQYLFDECDGLPLYTNELCDCLWGDVKEILEK